MAKEKLAVRTIESYLPCLHLFERILAEVIGDVPKDYGWTVDSNVIDAAYELNHAVALDLYCHLFGCLDLPDAYQDGVIEQLCDALSNAPLYLDMMIRTVEDWQEFARAETKTGAALVN